MGSVYRDDGRPMELRDDSGDRSSLSKTTTAVCAITRGRETTASRAARNESVIGSDRVARRRPFLKDQPRRCESTPSGSSRSLEQFPLSARP